MPLTPEKFAAELIGLVMLSPTRERNEIVAKAIRDRDFQIMTSTCERIGGTSNE